MSQEQPNKKDQKIYFIDKENFKTAEDQLSVQFLLVDQAKEDPAEATLALRHGNDTKKYKDLNELITIENGMKFVVFHNDPTTVSQVQ